jgi:hypothetical protein
MDAQPLEMLCPHQRRALHALVAGAQLIRRWGRWEAYIERDGKVGPMGVQLSDSQMKQLVDIGVELRPDPGTGQAFGFAWLPASLRPACADALTLTMPTEFLRIPSPTAIRDAVAENAMPTMPVRRTVPMRERETA